jgi:alpha-aminoadipic semialdehyde synthase
MGIKETPLSTLITSPVPSPAEPGRKVSRTHLMFSHTIKGQEYNMSLLSRFLGGGDAFHSGAKSEPGLEARLIDYELLTDESGKRTVMFGFFAGGAKAFCSRWMMLIEAQLLVPWNHCRQWRISTSRRVLLRHSWCVL